MPHTAGRGTQDARQWTREAVLALPDDGYRHELIAGELVVTPAPAPRHQAAAAELFQQLDAYLRQHRAGLIWWSPADIALGADEILQPDLFVFRPADGQVPKSWQEIDHLLLAVEILSPSTAPYDRGLKRHRYQQAGVPEYWIVDLDARLVERWRPADARPEILTSRLTWQPDAGGPVLDLDLDAVFGAGNP